MKVEQEIIARSSRIAELIAYLSLCMLAAAFGALLGRPWCQVWAVFGAFGLASAIGLDVLHRARMRVLLRERHGQAKRQAERNLDRELRHLESSRAILAAVRRLTQEEKGAEARVARRGAEPRWSLNKRATITRLRGFSASPENRLGESRTALVRDISRHGIGLAHAGRLERGPVLVALGSENGPSFQFIVDLLWCERQEDDSYFSGGKLIAVDSSGKGQHPATAATPLPPEQLSCGA